MWRAMYNKKTREVEVFKSTFNWWAGIFGFFYGLYKGNYLFAALSFGFGCILVVWSLVATIGTSVNFAFQAQMGHIPLHTALSWIKKLSWVIQLVSIFFSLIFNGSLFPIIHEVVLRRKGFTDAGLYKDKWDAKKVAGMLVIAKKSKGGGK